jgi:PAS domain S-box-containing protein
MWGSRVCASIVLAAAYFLAAKLALGLLTSPEGVPLFWPGSGVAIGTLYLLDRRARVAPMIAIVVAVIAANYLSGLTLLSSTFFGVFNAGEAILAVWLLERWFGGELEFNELSRVLGFLVVAGLTATYAAIGCGAILSKLSSGTSFIGASRACFLSHGLGIVVITPLLIEFGRLRWALPPQTEVREGAAALTLLSLIAFYVLTAPSGSWFTLTPLVGFLPPMSWLAARCRPLFVAGGLLLVSSVLTCTMIVGVGRFGDARLPLEDRVLAGQVSMLIATICTLTLAALFSERRKSQLVLESANTRLRELEAGFRRLLEALPAAVETADTSGRITYCNHAAERLWGKRPVLKRDSWHENYRLYDRDGTPIPIQDQPIHICLTEGRPVQREDVLLERDDGTRIPVASFASPLFDQGGKLSGIVDMQIDISERKRAEQALAERNAQFVLAHKVARVGSFAYDNVAKTMQLSRASAAIYGLSQSTIEISGHQWRACVHPDDVRHLQADHRRAFKEQQCELLDEFRIVRPGGEVRWIEARTLVSYNNAGRAQRMIGVYIDVTERKQAEDHKSLLIAELDHRVKNVLSTVSTVAARTMDASSSMRQFVASLDGRIRSMARTHELLSATQWQGISVRELVQRELAPYATRGNTEIRGPDMILKAEAGQAMGMVFHELATNAAKYGALSAANGRVSIRWERRLDGQARCHLALEWREVGGPPVVTPRDSGFGTSIIRDLIPYEFGGAAHLAFDRAGIRCHLELPADWFSGDAEPSRSITHPNGHQEISALEQVAPNRRDAKSCCNATKGPAGRRGVRKRKARAFAKKEA